MDLFSGILTKPINILESDGIADYYGSILSFEESEYYFKVLSNTIEWKNDSVIIYGKEMTTKRKVAWYGEEKFKYTYSNMTKVALPFTKEISSLKNMVEDKCREKFNSCLLNLYHSGDEGMAWHSDDEIALKKDGAIASLSLGAVRKFSFKNKQTKKTISLQLDNGSLLVMKGETQRYWLHSLPKTKKINLGRINLTFRTINL